MVGSIIDSGRPPVCRTVRPLKSIRRCGVDRHRCIVRQHLWLNNRLRNAAKLIPLSQATPDDARLIEIARGVSDTMFKICAHESYIDIYTSDDDLKALMADMIPLTAASLHP